MTCSSQLPIDPDNFSRAFSRLCESSIAITKDVYGHLVEGDKRAAAESMSRVLFGTCSR